MADLFQQGNSANRLALDPTIEGERDIIGEVLTDKLVGSSTGLNTVAPFQDVGTVVNKLVRGDSPENQSYQDTLNREKTLNLATGNISEGNAAAELVTALPTYAGPQLGARLGMKSAIKVANKAMDRVAQKTKQEIAGKALKGASTTREAIEEAVEGGLEATAGAIAGEAVSATIFDARQTKKDNQGFVRTDITPESAIKAFVANAGMGVLMDTVVRGGEYGVRKAGTATKKKNLYDSSTTNILNLKSMDITAINQAYKNVNDGEGAFIEIDDLSKAGTGAYKSGEEYVINTHKLGTIRGTIKTDQATGQPALTVDMKKSDVSNEAIGLVYGDQNLLDTTNRGFLDRTDTVEEHETQSTYTETEEHWYSVGEEGNLDQNAVDRIESEQGPDVFTTTNKVAELKARTNKLLSTGEATGFGKAYDSAMLAQARASEITPGMSNPSTAATHALDGSLDEATADPSLMSVMKQVDNNVEDLYNGVDTRPSVLTYSNKSTKPISKDVNGANSPANSFLYDIQDKPNADGSISFTGTLKKSIAKDLDKAIEIALATGDTTRVNGKEFYTTKARRGLAAKASSILVDDFYRIDPEGQNGLMTDTIKAELQTIAETVIEARTTKDPTTQDGTRNANNIETSNTYPELLEDNFSSEWNKAKKALGGNRKGKHTHFVKDGDIRTPKVKDNTYGKTEDMMTLAELESTVMFKTSEDAVPFMADLQAIVDDDMKLLAYLKQTQPEFISEATKHESFTDLEAFRQEFEAAKDAINRLKTNEGLQFDSEIQSSLRVRYTADYTPHSSKLWRTMFTPEAPLHDVSRFDNTTHQKAMRSILSLIDAKRNGSPISAITGDVDAMFRENYIKYSNKTNEQLIMLSQDAEGLHSLHGFIALKKYGDWKFKKGSPEMKIYTEIDGKNQGPAILRTLAGNLDQPGLGVGIKGAQTGLDHYNGILAKIEQQMKVKGNGSAVVQALYKEGELTKDIAKYGMIPLDYGAMSDSLKSYFGDAFITDMLNNLAKPEGLQKLRVVEQLVFASSQLNLSDINAMKQSIRDTQRDIREAAGNSVEIADLNSLLAEQNKQLEDMYNSTAGSKHYNPDVVSALEKIKKDYTVTLEKALTKNRDLGYIEAVDKETITMTKEEREALTKYLGEDTNSFIDQTFDNIYRENGSPMNESSDFIRFVNLLKDTGEELQMEFAIALHNPNVNKKGLAEHIGKLLADSNENVSAVNASRLLSRSFNKKKSLSIMDVNQAILDAGYNPYKIVNTWKPMRDASIKINNFRDQTIALVNENSNLGLVQTPDGKNLNLKTISFIENFLPLIAIGQDASFMADSLGSTDLSLFDAQFGDFLSVEAGTKGMNQSFATMGLNYNIISEFQAELQRMKNYNSGADITNPEIAMTIARFQTKPDTPSAAFMETVDKARTQIGQRESTIEASDLNSRLDVEANRINTEQNAHQGTLDVSNATLGTDSNTGSATKTGSNWEPTKNTQESSATDLDMDPYREVKSDNTNYMGDTVDFLTMGDLHGKKSTNVTVVIGEKNSFDDATGILTINTRDVTENSVALMMHEIGHKGIFTVQHGTNDTYGNTGKIMEIINSGKIPLTTVNAVTNKTASYHNSKSEALTNLFESLLYNEVIMQNKEAFVSHFKDGGGVIKKNKDGTYDLTPIINRRYVTVKDVDGNDVKIHTIRDLKSHLARTEKDDLLNAQIDNVYSSIYASLNSSQGIKDWFNGVSPEPFLGSRENNPLFRQEEYDDATGTTLAEFKKDLVRNQSTLALFSIDKQTEAIHAIAGKAKNADQQLNKIAAEHLERAVESIKQLADGRMDVKELDNRVGDIMSSGIHHLLDYAKKDGITFEGFMKQLSKHDVYVGKNRVLNDFVQNIVDKAGLTIKDSDKKKIAHQARSRVVGLSGTKNNFKGNHNSLELSRFIMGEIDKVAVNNVGMLAEGLNKLSNGDITTTLYKPDLDVMIATQRMKGSRRVSRVKLKETFEFLFTNSKPEQKSLAIKNAEVWKVTEDRLMTQGLYDNQFGTNAKAMFKSDKYKISMTGRPEQKAGEINVHGTKVPVYMVESKDLYMMEQDSVFVNVNVDDFQKGVANIPIGIVKKDGEGKTFVNVGGQDIYIDARTEGKQIKARISLDSLARRNMAGRKNIDTSYSTMLQRNLNLLTSDDVKRTAFNDQMRIGLESGLIKSAEWYNQNPDMQDSMQKMGDPIDSEGGKLYASKSSQNIQASYGDVYYQERFRTDVEGTKGANVGRAIEDTFGPGASVVIKDFVKTFIGLRDVFKTSLLLWNPGSWINSAVSSMGIYMVHAKGASMFQDRSDAYAMLDEYKVAMKELSDAYFEGDAKMIKEKQKAAKATEMYEAAQIGMSSTIRTDAQASGTYGSNPMYGLLDKYTGSTGASDAMKQLHLDPSKKAGAAAGSYFDKTEFMPKLMLYANMKRNGMSDRQAAQYTTMANPQYNRNLSGIWNLIDQVSPYTKYFVSYPTMLNFAWSTNKTKLIALVSSMKAMFAATWLLEDELTEEDKAMMWNGYFNLPGEYAKYGNSMINYFPPFINPADNYSVDPMFVADLVAEGHTFLPMRAGVSNTD